jgi:hypothetical protein
MPFEPDGNDTAPLAEDSAQAKLMPMKTIDLGPVAGEVVVDPDDLFSKTGFVTPSAEGRIPAISGSRASSFKTPFASGATAKSQAAPAPAAVRPVRR